MPTHHLGRTRFGDPKNKGHLMPIEEAHALLNDWVPNERLRLHMKQVAAIMRAWAIQKEAADEQTALKWELAGLLHDADWEKYPDDHCRVIIEELEKEILTRKLFIVLPHMAPIILVWNRKIRWIK